ncbi:MAG TPA: hypothetical protein VFR07_15650 [Mycobacteriales bacterium]|jgi:hypothetical protein|nr:hypothetical protein [Mycobacteriales bacterium]
MSRRSPAARRFAVLLSTGLALVGATTSSAVASAAPAPATSGFTLVGGGEQVPLLATAGDGTATFVDDAVASRPSTTAAATATATATATAKITVTYHGFPAPAKAAFQRAVNMWQQNVASSVPITIDATWKALGTGVLGSAGTNKIWQQESTKTYFVDALANKISKSQMDPSPDIIANFNSSFSNWYFGTGKAPVGTYDFESVVAHEIGHGLGFLGAGNVANGKGSVTYNGGFAFGYAKYAENAAGKKLVSYTPQPSAAVAAQLTGGKLFFDSPAVRNANGGKPAKLYAPSSWQPGSSFSHLDEATFRKGNVNSLMTPQLADGETIRTPGKITKAVFATIGW